MKNSPVETQGLSIQHDTPITVWADSCLNLGGKNTKFREFADRFKKTQRSMSKQAYFNVAGNYIDVDFHVHGADKAIDLVKKIEK